MPEKGIVEIGEAQMPVCCSCKKKKRQSVEAPIRFLKRIYYQAFFERAAAHQASSHQSYDNKTLVRLPLIRTPGNLGDQAYLRQAGPQQACAGMNLIRAMANLTM